MQNMNGQTTDASYKAKGEPEAEGDSAHTDEEEYRPNVETMPMQQTDHITKISKGRRRRLDGVWSDD